MQGSGMPGQGALGICHGVAQQVGSGSNACGYRDSTDLPSLSQLTHRAACHDRRSECDNSASDPIAIDCAGRTSRCQIAASLAAMLLAADRSRPLH